MALGGLKHRVFSLAALFLLGASSLSFSVAHADVLQGEVQENGELMRIERGNNNGPPQQDLRSERGIPLAPPRLRSGLVDTTAFSQPLNGSAQKDGASLGLIAPGQFGTIPNNKFDLGTERGSKELTLAWERWHKQLSEAIYGRWSQLVTVPGTATVRVTVTKTRHVQLQMVRSSGNPLFDSSLMEAISSLDGNPGLTFPSQSEREFVTLESDYIAGHHVDPGFSWVKDDYEKVNKTY